MNNEWFERANCHDMDPDLFFPKRGQSISPEVDAACDGCTEFSSGNCLEYAIVNYVHGRWAKTSPRDRAAIRRVRKMRAEPPEEKWNTA